MEFPIKLLLPIAILPEKDNGPSLSMSSVAVRLILNLLDRRHAAEWVWRYGVMRVQTASDFRREQVVSRGTVHRPWPKSARNINDNTPVQNLGTARVWVTGEKHSWHTDFGWCAGLEG